MIPFKSLTFCLISIKWRNGTDLPIHTINLAISNQTLRLHDKVYFCINILDRAFRLRNNNNFCMKSIISEWFGTVSDLLVSTFLIFIIYGIELVFANLISVWTL